MGLVSSFIRSVLAIALLLGAVWCSFNVPLGERTFAEHMDRIGQTPEALELIEGSRQTVTHSSTAVATSECWAMFTRNTPPVWLPFPPMIHARKFANSVLLPDASILVVGGGTAIGHVPGVNYLSSSATTTLPHLVVVDVDSRARA